VVHTVGVVSRARADSVAVAEHVDDGDLTAVSDSFCDRGSQCSSASSQIRGNRL